MKLVGISAGRRRKDRAMRAVLAAATLLALVPLVLIIWYLLKKGFGALSADFFTTDPNGNFLGNPGGVKSAILGTLEMVGLATLMAPAGTPPEIVARLSREVAAIVRMPVVRDQLVAMGLEVVGDTPSEFGAYMRRESPKWAKVIRDAHVKAE